VADRKTRSSSHQNLHPDHQANNQVQQVAYETSLEGFSLWIVQLTVTLESVDPQQKMLLPEE
jgi:hypothetical protein